MKKLFNTKRIVMVAFMFCLGIAAAVCMPTTDIRNMQGGEQQIREFFASSGGSSSSQESHPQNTIVIDPGHGGLDGGASGKSGVLEKDINLRIAQCLAEKISDYPVQIRMTRTDEGGLYSDGTGTIRQKKREDLLRRKEIMEGKDVMLSVSIHLNSYSGSEKIYGAQVFYPKQQKKGTNVPDEKSFSQIVAESVQNSLNTNIPDAKKRSAMPKGDILIFQNTSANIILVECGFLSNEREENLLKTAEYQHLLSDAIWEGINEILCLEKKEKIKIIDSANKNDLSPINNSKICG